MPAEPVALFAFESEFQTDLRCIPMSVRHKLDLVGIKMSLKEWVRLGPEGRAAVVQLPGGDAEALQRFDAEVVARVEREMGAAPQRCAIDPSPAWADREHVPAEVTAKALAEGVAVTPAQWAALAPLQRFALYKLSRSSHKNENFVPACREFGIVGPRPVSAAPLSSTAGP